MSEASEEHHPVIVNLIAPRSGAYTPPQVESAAAPAARPSGNCDCGDNTGAGAGGSCMCGSSSGAGK